MNNVYFAPNEWVKGLVICLIIIIMYSRITGSLYLIQDRGISSGTSGTGTGRRNPAGGAGLQKWIRERAHEPIFLYWILWWIDRGRVHVIKHFYLGKGIIYKSDWSVHIYWVKFVWYISFTWVKGTLYAKKNFELRFFFHYLRENIHFTGVKLI